MTTIVKKKKKNPSLWSRAKLCSFFIVPDLSVPMRIWVNTILIPNPLGIPLAVGPHPNFYPLSKDKCIHSLKCLLLFMGELLLASKMPLSPSRRHRTLAVIAGFGDCSCPFLCGPCDIAQSRLPGGALLVVPLPRPSSPRDGQRYLWLRHPRDRVVVAAGAPPGQAGGHGVSGAGRPGDSGCGCRLSAGDPRKGGGRRQL
jgi:hypothetical protein